mmetsp:Transcript_5636/g.13060  ORF Transcript_5636/g.13060 Transcript_5636/m.13060 type:complete len:310 (-) Transcript_5636:249-1178(-)
MHCKLPRASAGLSRLAASIAPSAAPAPTSVWISSMKSTVSFEEVTSSTTSFSRCSNSPRYLVSATSSPSSSETSRLPSSRGGTRSSTIACASASAIAVLPTPGSPMSTGFDLRRRTRICRQRRTSASRPTTGSSSPSRACCVRSIEHCASVVFFFELPPPPTSARSPRSTPLARLARSTPSCMSILLAPEPSPPSSTASTSVFAETRSPFADRSTAARSAVSVSLANGRSSSRAVVAKRFSRRGSPFEPPCLRWSRIEADVSPSRSSDSCNSEPCSVAASNRCSVSIAVAPRVRASDCASITSRIASLS